MIDSPPAASGSGAASGAASGNGVALPPPAPEAEPQAGTGTGGAYVPIGRAAALLGLSGDVLRKRAAAGSVQARKVDSRWWIWIDGAAPTADVGGPPAAPLPEAVGPAPEAAGELPEAAPAPPGREEWRQLLGLVEKLQEENRNLAGQLGFVQAQRQVLEERVKLLEAPPEPEPAPASEPEPEAAPRSWWHRALAWLRG
jgi:hypothetical protein